MVGGFPTKPHYAKTTPCTETAPFIRSIAEDRSDRRIRLEWLGLGPKRSPLESSNFVNDIN